MVTIDIVEDRLVIEVQGMDKFWSLRSRLEIPLAHVRSVAPAPDEALGWFSALKVAGSHIPGVISAGTFYQDGGLVFWDIHDATNAIGIDLEDERYHRLVVEVADPSAAIAQITRAKRHP